MNRIFYIFIFIVSIVYGNVNVNYGIKTSLEQNFYDYQGKSFKTKVQIGGGFENFLKLYLNDFLGFEFTFPGFYYFAGSDTKGGYLYPDKVKLPIGFDFIFSYKIKSFCFEFNIGGGVPYFLIFSYYYPRYFLPEISGGIGVGYWLNDRFVVNISLNMGNYFDQESDVNFSILYSLSFGYRVF